MATQLVTLAPPRHGGTTYAAASGVSYTVASDGFLDNVLSTDVASLISQGCYFPDITATGATRSLTREGLLGQKVAALDRSYMPGAVSNGTNAQETWSFVRRAQNPIKNLQLEFPAFGPFSIGTNTKISQRNEETWPHEFRISACVFISVYSGIVSSFSASVLTDAGTPGWTTSQWISPVSQAITTLNVNGALTAGLTMIPLKAATANFIRKDTLLPVNARMQRVSADTPVGSLGIPVYSLAGTQNDNDAIATQLFDGPTYHVIALSGSSVGRNGLITASAAGTVTVPQGLTTMANGDTYQIVAAYPLTFNGERYALPNMNDYWVNDPLGVEIPTNSDVYARAFVQPTNGTSATFPIHNASSYGADGGSATDVCYGFYNAALSTGGYCDFASYGDPILDGSKIYPSWVNWSDSKTLGVGDKTFNNRTFGWASRASVGNAALINMGCSGEAGFPPSFVPGMSKHRQRILGLADFATWAYNANDELDGTVGPASSAQMQANATQAALFMQQAGVPKRISVTCGPLTSGQLASYFKGNESQQTTVQVGNLSAVDNWLAANINTGYTLNYDVRPVVQLGGLTGTAGKWRTFDNIATGNVITVNGASTTLVDTTNLNTAIDSSWPFSQANNPQEQFQGCGVILHHTASGGATPVTISATSAGTLTTLTVARTSSLKVGDPVTIAGYTGNWTPVNGTQTINTIVNGTQITVAINSSGFGAVTGSPTLLATNEYNYVNQANGTNTSGTLQMAGTWLSNPSFNAGVNPDTYDLQPIASNNGDGTHYSVFIHYLLSIDFQTFARANGVF